MVRLVTALMGAALLAASVPGCSSVEEKEPDFADPELPGREANPDGVAYPTDHLGGAQRSGKRPGDRIPNFTFQAYIDGDRAAGLQTVSLADYYDPQQTRHKLLHIEVAAVWCAICTSYAEATVKLKEPLGREGVVFLEVMIAGKTGGIGPSLGDVDRWVTANRSNFTTAIDVRARRLASIGVEPGTMPWDIMIDTRTMEILESKGGAPLELAQYDRSFLKAIASRGPAY